MRAKPRSNIGKIFAAAYANAMTSNMWLSWNCRLGGQYIFTLPYMVGSAISFCVQSGIQYLARLQMAKQKGK